MEGWISLHRQVLISEIWKKPPEYLKIFLYILLKVNHKDNKLFPRGSNFFNWSEELKDLPGVSRNQIWDFMRWAKSEKIDFLTTQKTTRGMVIKVNNYDRFQSVQKDQLQNRFQNDSRTAPEQLQNDSSTINNNDNNEINKINLNISNSEELKPFKKPSVDELKSYCSERKNKIDPNTFFDFYEAKGWMIGKGKMKDWKAAVRTWEKRNKEKVKQVTINSEEDDIYARLSR